jgi:hypothetical protein
MQSLDAYITPFPAGPGAGRVACIAAMRPRH